MKFKNKVIWITDTSSGIGKAVTLNLSITDCKIILSSRNNEELIEVKNK